jgi:hypothetical protein
MARIVLAHGGNGDFLLALTSLREKVQGVIHAIKQV